MRNAAACSLMLIALLVGAARQSEAKGIAVALDDFLVRITTGFSGRQVLLFGATDAPGDVIVVVHGPTSEIQVRKKSQVAGIWINRDQVTFSGVPGFYAIASSKPLDETLSPAALASHHIGVSRIKLEPDNPSLADFKTALFRIKQNEGLFAERVGRVTFIGERLFRATISIPSSVPTGTFLIDIFVARDGEIVESEGQQLPLIVSKIGFGADIYDFAHRHSYAYGAIAVLVALMAGWVAHLAFRRR
jgi:uncharacterized protein (TIGR02186 family)